MGFAQMFERVVVVYEILKYVCEEFDRDCSKSQRGHVSSGSSEDGQGWLPGGYNTWGLR